MIRNVDIEFAIFILSEYKQHDIFDWWSGGIVPITFIEVFLLIFCIKNIG